MAALYARYLDTFKMIEPIKRFISLFRSWSLIKNLTLPLISYFSGWEFTNRIREVVLLCFVVLSLTKLMADVFCFLFLLFVSCFALFCFFYQLFGDIGIEDLWVRYFCVSTNMTHSDMQVHMRGDLACYVRASMTVVGLLPPILDPTNGDMLVDGYV